MIISHLKQAILNIERLQRKVTLKDGRPDFGVINSLEYYKGRIEEIIECDHGESGLRPLFKNIWQAEDM